MKDKKYTILHMYIYTVEQIAIKSFDIAEDFCF